MRRTKLLVIAVLPVLFVACAAPVASTAPPAGMDVVQWSAQGTAIAVGTLNAAEATRQHVAATGTAVAEQQAAAQATATSVAVVATATWDALLVQQKAAEIAAFEAAAIQAVTATAEADRAALAFQVAQSDMAIAQRTAELQRVETWNRLIPWLVGIFLFVVMGAAFTYYAERLMRSRPQQAGDTWVVYAPNRGPVVVDQPRQPKPLNPAPVMQLPAMASPPPLADKDPVSLPRLQNGHVMIAGETGAGKSSVMFAVLQSRPNVTVLDPHWDGQDWGSARVVGAGRDFDAIREFMRSMEEELQSRYYARSNRLSGFEPMTVAVNEMPAIVSVVGKEIEGVWRSWLREGRKVGLYLVLATQSTRVRTLGIEGESDLLENFTYVLTLGNVARREHGALVEGMSFPAVLQSGGRARPVLVPRREEIVFDADGDGDNDVVFLGGNGNGAVQLPFTAPLPRYEMNPNDLSHHDRLRIIDAYRRHGGNISAVQRELFPSYQGRGGRAFYAIREVVRKDERTEA